MTNEESFQLDRQNAEAAASYGRPRPQRLSFFGTPRVPPGQRVVNDFPVLHAGGVPAISPSEWRLDITGLVENPLQLSLSDLLSLPAAELVCDIHCVTGWSKLETSWKGVPVGFILQQARPYASAKHAIVHAEEGWTTNLPLEQLWREHVLVAYEYEGKPLAPEHGGPVRLVVPQLYFWKSAKWLCAIELVEHEQLGFWETRGYHRLGDPWLEQRYAED